MFMTSHTLRMTSPERQALLTLASIYSLRMLGLFMILPIFSMYAKQLTHASPLRIGIALGIYGLTQTLFQIPFGYISDRLGRKPLIILGLMLLAMGSGVAAMSQSIFGVIAGRGIQGMGATGGVIMALLADSTRDEVRLRAMAFIGITIGLSFALAFILGPILNGWVGVQGIFWLTALFSIIAIGVVIVFLPIPESNSLSISKIFSKSFSKPLASQELQFPKFPIKAKESFRSVLNFLKEAGLLPLYGGVLVLHASLTAVFLKIPLAVESFHYESGEIWRFYLPVLLASFILTVPIILLMEKVRQFKWVMAFTVVLLALSELGILIFFQSWFGLSLCMGLFFTAFNVLEASLPSHISKKVELNQKGTALGIFSALQFLGLFLGGTLGGLLDSWGGLVAVQLFCVILALVWFFWIIHTRK